MKTNEICASDYIFAAGKEKNFLNANARAVMLVKAESSNANLNEPEFNMNQP